MTADEAGASAASSHAVLLCTELVNAQIEDVPMKSSLLEIALHELFSRAHFGY
jgi:hypothetical protein